jgi:hypothetical protein
MSRTIMTDNSEDEKEINESGIYVSIYRNRQASDNVIRKMS